VQTEQKNKGMNNFGKMGWAVIIYTLMIYLFTCVTNDTLNVSTGFFGGFLQVDPNSLLPFAALGGLAGVVLSLIAGLVIAKKNVKMPATVLFVLLAVLFVFNGQAKNVGMFAAATILTTAVSQTLNLVCTQQIMSNWFPRKKGIALGWAVAAAESLGLGTCVIGDARAHGPEMAKALQDVFQAMGPIGPLFGVIFYLFVLVAAISSAIALIEVVVTFLLDHAESKGKQGSRPKTVFWVCVAIMVEAALVAVDGLGSNGVWVPFQKMIGVGPWNDCWLDFMDAFSEGLAMPAGALIMSIMIGWELRTKPITDEIHHGAEQIHWLNRFMDICLKFIVPIAMAFILGGQIGDFFTMDAETQGQSVYYIGYVIGAVILLVSWLVAINSPKRKEPL